MENMHLVDMRMPPQAGSRPWGPYDFWMLFGMWTVMMVSMMTPSVIPMVLMYTAVNKGEQKKGLPYSPAFIFLSGYLVAWSLFSIGCCWALMVVLFAVGVINMLWVLLITAFVLLEKVGPVSQHYLRATTGLGLVVWSLIGLPACPWIDLLVRAMSCLLSPFRRFSFAFYAQSLSVL